MPLTPNDLKDIRDLLIEPVQQAVRDELKPLSDTAKDHEDRLKKLESNQRNALLGYAGIVAALTVAWNLAWDRIKKAIGW